MSSPRPKMMTADDFKKNTSSFLARRKNPLLLDIDAHLRDVAKAKSQSEEAAAVQKVVLACAVWLDLKKAKDKSRRREAVEKLQAEATALLAWLSYANHKTASKSKAYGTTGLTDDTYLEKMVPRNKPHVAAYTMHQALADGAVEADANPAQIAKAALDRGAVQLAYYTKTERLKTLVFPVVTNGSALLYRRKANDKGVEPLHTADGPGGCYLYVLDGYGNLYAAPDSQTKGLFHHSSFVRGKDVICAGSMVVENGKLKDISNMSGHYHPSADRLKEAVVLLRDEYDVSLHGCFAAVVRVVGRPATLDVYRAVDFAGSGTKALPWKEEKRTR